MHPLPPGVPTYATYTEAIAGLPLPLAYIDMDLLDANARAILKRAGPLPLRLATKSLRCLEITRYLLNTFPQFQGLMAFAAKEAALLAEAGFDNILIAYPTLELSEIRACLPHIRQGRRIVFMVDSVEHLSLLETIAAEAHCTLSLCIDFDLSSSFPGLHFGVYRSPLRKARDLIPLVEVLRQSPHLQLLGLMGYEAQLAGVTDSRPAAPVYNFLVRILKRLSARDCLTRRQAAVAMLRAHGHTLQLVNAGGTGSLELTRTDPSLTELTVGSGLYSPTLFDQYKDFRHLPAAGFVLPVVRQASAGIYACSGGGYVASGAVHHDKQPQVMLPTGIRLFKSLGAGEVQTSLCSKSPLRLGQAIFFRHAKAGELLERFAEVQLIRQGKHVGAAKTYRGEGWSFF